MDETNSPEPRAVEQMKNCIDRMLATLEALERALEALDASLHRETRKTDAYFRVGSFGRVVLWETRTREQSFASPLPQHQPRKRRSANIMIVCQPLEATSCKPERQPNRQRHDKLVAPRKAKRHASPRKAHFQRALVQQQRFLQQPRKRC